MSRRDRRALNSQERSSVAWFLDQAGRIPLLTHEEEILLGRSVQAMMRLLREKPDGPYDGDEKRILRTGKRAKDRFIKANLRLVVNVAKKYLVAVRSLELNDLIQEGMFGLIRGVEKFDPERGYKASTYFYWWIRQGVSRAISQQDLCIRLPINAIECLNKVRNWAPEFLEEHGRAPNFEECAEYCGITPIVMRRYLMHSTGVGSLDQVARNDDNSSELIELIAGTETSPMEAMELDDGITSVRAWMCGLRKQEARVIELIHDFDGQGPRTQSEAGQALGVSRQRVGEIHRRAMRKMRLHASAGAVA